MAKKIIKARLKQRTDTQANWAANNPVLLEGELGLVTDDKNLYKVGDGVTAWNDLPFRGFDGTLVHETGDSDNAAMSQRGVTRALAKLEENMANNEKIKELSGKIEQLAEENTRLKERIEEQDVFIEDLEYHKLTANSDNRYPDISVGTADNLAGVDVVDSEINFRRSGGGAITDGVARIESIKGNSVVWNNLIEIVEAVGLVKSKMTGELINGVFKGRTISEQPASSIGIPALKWERCIAGHKYMWIYEATNSLSLTVSAAIGTTTQSGQIITSSSAAYCYFYPFGITGTIPVGSEFEIKSINFFDLTQMFGSGNEPTTIEEFYQRIPMGVDLNAYNEGEVIHMGVQSIESQGANAWDEEWELGSIYSATGEIANNSNAKRSKNFFPVLPNTAYYATYTGASLYIFWYDKDKNFIKNQGMYAGYSYTSPSNAAFAKFYTGGTTYNHDICINLSDASVNGKYYPYIKRQEDLSIIRKYFPQGMKSAGSAHDEIRYNKASGKWEKVQRIGEIDISGAKAYTAVENTFFLPIADMKAPTNNAERGTGLLCAKYPMHGGVDGYNVAGMSDKSMLRMSNGNIYIKDSAFGSDAAAFKAAMQGVMLYYELAEPIITELDKEDQLKDRDYSVWNDGTERANAEGKSSAFAADLTYGFNAVGKIKELEGLVAQLRAKVGI